MTHPSAPPWAENPAGPAPATTTADETTTTPARRPALLSELIMPLVLAAFATYMLVNMLTMSVPDTVDFPGPRFFPGIITGVIYVLVVLDVIGILRRRTHPDPAVQDEGDHLVGHPPTSGFSLHSDAATAAGLTAHEGRGGSTAATAADGAPGTTPDTGTTGEQTASVPEEATFSWSALVWVVGGFLAFTLLLEFLGWVIAAGLLFWCVARGFGSKRPLLALIVGLTVSSLAYIAFDMLLGLNLPSGILGGGF